VLLGEHREITEALAGSAVYTSNFVSIALVLHNLRVNAASAGIALPARLTIVPDDKPACERFRRDIDAYREAAGARVAKARLAPA
jgi:hypothetical protein